ncbi:MAG: hypothetical protein R2711_18060 [Acidimicrobiales bacterium]
MAATLKQRKKHESIKLNCGSLYNVVDQLGATGSSRWSRSCARVGARSGPSTASPRPGSGR